MLVLIAETVSSGICCARLRVTILLVLGNGASMFHLFFFGEIFRGSGSSFQGLPRFLVSIGIWFDSLTGITTGSFGIILVWACASSLVLFSPGGARVFLHQIHKLLLELVVP